MCRPQTRIVAHAPPVRGLSESVIATRRQSPHGGGNRRTAAVIAARRLLVSRAKTRRWHTLVLTPRWRAGAGDGGVSHARVALVRPPPGVPPRLPPRGPQVCVCVCVCVAVAAFQKEGSLPADSDTAGPLPLSAPVSRECLSIPVGIRRRASGAGYPVPGAGVSRVSGPDRPSRYRA